MATLPETQAELEALRAKVAAESRAARDAGDTARREQLRALIGEIDDELDRLALADLRAAADRLVSYRTRLEALTRVVLSWPFGSAEAPAESRATLQGQGTATERLRGRRAHRTAACARAAASDDRPAGQRRLVGELPPALEYADVQ